MTAARRAESGHADARNDATPVHATQATDQEFPRWRRSVAVIALGAGMASFAMNFWVPFLPVYMKQLGAGDDAAALAWVGIAFAGTGIARLVSGPVWGWLADRYGRKRMFVRALFAATFTTVIAAGASAPWHVAVAWTSQGLLSGFIPAAVALTSVSVPRARLTSALGSVQGAQYAGNTLGPVIGALLAGLFGLRGAVIAGSLVPSVAAAIVLLTVPADRAGRPPVEAGASPVPTHGRGGGWVTALTGGLSLQLGLGLLLYFVVHSTGGLVRTSAPVSLEHLTGRESVTGLAGWTFAAGGLGSAAGALGLARLLRAPGRMRVLLTGIVVLAAVAHALLSVAVTVWLFVLGFALAGLCQGGILPAANTVIASAVPFERRGAAFGLASSVQALAFVVGPMSAAWFAATSLTAGYILLGAILAVVALVMGVFLREPGGEIVKRGAPS